MNMKKQNVRTISLIVVTFTYLLIGAAVFDAFESQVEQNQRNILNQEEMQLRDRYNISEADFNRITWNIINSIPHKAGIQWKFIGSFYFATTVITTIGYGHSTPKTVGGKIFCMFYALAGIPLNLVMFQSIGERLNILVTYLLRQVKKCLRFKDAEVSQTHLILISMNMSSVVVMGGAWAFSHYEGWTYLDSFYYCVITLTTVGFGDFVALQRSGDLQNKPEYVAFSILFILFGLAVVSAAMNLLVLRFLTMNTADERRDEMEAVAALRSSVRLDGDVITVNGSTASANEPPPPPPQEEQLTTVETYDDRSTTACSCTCCAIRSQQQQQQQQQQRRQRYRVTRSPAAKITHLLPLHFIESRPSPYVANTKDDFESCFRTPDFSYSIREALPAVSRRKRNSL